MPAYRYEMQFGDLNVGLLPVFEYFVRQDTGAAVAAPPIVEAPWGHGAYYFDFDWSGVQPGVSAISWKVVLGGVEQSDVIRGASGSAPGGTTPLPGAPLPGQQTLAAIRLLAQQRSDLANSGFVTPAEWLSYINGSYAELYNLLIEKYGSDYNAPERFQFVTTGLVDTYQLPDGSATYLNTAGTTALSFFKLLGVDVEATGTPSGWLPLKPFMMGERNNMGVSGQLTRRPRYRITKNALWFRPQPQSGLRMQVLYAPRLTPLVNDTDLVDGVSGWEELIIVDAARKALLKEESDTSGLEREKAALVARIEHEAANRDVGEPPTVADVERGGYDLPGYGYWIQ